ncbi:MAG: 1,4-alpha-glucan branching protein GlgB [Hyphomicrobiaceae bacterium]|nr:1,4-alpha-glucan branching protein GlgB [Hyphomicrobiaceae bacterium]
MSDPRTGTQAADTAAAAAIAAGNHADPFAFLGPHPDPQGGGTLVRCFMPGVAGAEVVGADGRSLAAMERILEAGLFEARLPSGELAAPYRLRVRDHSGTHEIEDPYRFGPILGELDMYLLAEGSHERNFEKLGAHVLVHEGVGGVHFAVWAPNARRVSVVGDFNGWDGRCHPMRLHPGAGLWEIFIPGLGEGTLYKFEIKARDGTVLPLKADPYAFSMEPPPRTASRVTGHSGFVWNDERWMAERARHNATSAPISIYEVHAGSWRRHPDGRYLSYRELADTLVPYVKDMGFTHIELMPISEFPFDGSWGYQPIGLFAPTSRFGTPDDLRHFIDRCHTEGIGVILDWVVGHFPEDEHGLVRFDGTHLYEHADPRLGRHADWGTLIYNFGRAEVFNYLIGNALYWLHSFHVDGLRVDAVASMLYLDYSRKPGEWLPNRHGGNENLEAIAFLRLLNEKVYGKFPGAFTVAEESTSWPMVSRPTSTGGLGFGYKWNMGWMNDTLRYISRDPVHRKHHHNDLTFSLMYAFTENFVLPLSHDEVVHGKRSLLGRMPGDQWQRFANLRLYLSYLFTHPGKKLLFMGGELAQEREWNHDAGLDWHLLQHDSHRGIQSLVRDLNALYTSRPALHQLDCDGGGFAWIDCNDFEQGVLSYRRHNRSGDDTAVVVCNFTPVPRQGYEIGVPQSGGWREIFNSDSSFYGGTNMGNSGRVMAQQRAKHGLGQSLTLTIPPLATLVLVPD